MQTDDEKYMRRCLQLAEYGHGKVSPNPMVGSVIVHEEKIIGEGYHQKYGGPHAEVNAINSVKNHSLLIDSTLYVNLEPCSHYGKTPPCSDLIIDKRFARVVIAATDPNPIVAGNGITRMRASGIWSEVGILGAEAKYLNRRFYKYHQENRPYIILKYASSKDGFIDHERTQEHPNAAWITNEYCRMLVHKWRTEEDAFMVGTNTVVLDNPKLTSRIWPGKNPLRVSLDELDILDENCNLLDNSVPTIIFTPNNKKDRENLKYEKIDFDKPVVKQILEILYSKSIQSVVVEGGRDLLQSFIDEDLWDEARVFTGNKIFGNGTPEPDLVGELYSENEYGDSVLKILYPIVK